MLVLAACLIVQQLATGLASHRTVVQSASVHVSWLAIMATHFEILFLCSDSTYANSIIAVIATVISLLFQGARGVLRNR